MPRSEENRLVDFELFFQRVSKPRPGVLPIAIGDRSRDLERFARFFDRKTPKEVKLGDFCGGRVFEPQLGQEFVQRQDEIGILRHGARPVKKFEPLAAAGSFQSVSVSCVIDENSPHRFRRRAKEVSAPVEALAPDQAKVRLVDQARRVERVPRNLFGHLRGRELPQLVVDVGNQFGSRLTVPGGGGVQKSSHSGHVV